MPGCSGGGPGALLLRVQRVQEHPGHPCSLGAAASPHAGHLLPPGATTPQVLVHGAGQSRDPTGAFVHVACNRAKKELQEQCLFGGVFVMQDNVIPDGKIGTPSLHQPAAMHDVSQLQQDLVPCASCGRELSSHPKGAGTRDPGK